MAAEGAGEQLALLKARARRRQSPKPASVPASSLPVARVVVELALPHLDRVFDYAVPQTLDEVTVPGVRCTVRVAGRRVPGFVVDRVETSEHPGRLQPLLGVPSPVPVLTPQVLQLARTVADANAGVLADVLRLAVPPRHATTEKSLLGAGRADAAPPGRPPPGCWADYRGGLALLQRITAGESPRAVWTALPGGCGHDWAAAVAIAAGTALSAGRGALIVVPDRRDVDRVLTAIEQLTPAPDPAAVIALVADLGPAARYRAFLRVLLGGPVIVVGTRAAAFAPVADLGLVVCWEDGDDLHDEPRAPYPHVRDVLRVRSEQSHAAALIGGLGRSAQAADLLAHGWARPVQATRDVLRTRTPRIAVAGDDDLRDPAARTARIPWLALRTAREALETGPVLIQVPRSGYLPGLACGRCRGPARCPRCGGPLAVSGPRRPPGCHWCGHTPDGGWRCRDCGGTSLRSVHVGSARTAEEIGLALRGATVRMSSAAAPGGVLARVGREPAVVVATPGAEPVADDGYQAAILLDGWVALSRPDLDAGLEALRRWLTAAALVRPAADGGRVVLVADSGAAPVQALVRWDPAGLAERDLAERRQLGLPPAGVLAEVRGSSEALAAFARAVRWPAEVDVLDVTPIWGSTDEHLLVRAPQSAAPGVASAMKQARGVLSAAKSPAPRVRMRVVGNAYS